MVHVASPVARSFENEDEVVKPAVNGTMAVVKACHSNRVRRLVVTSSIAAVTNVAAADKPADRIFNENHWTNPEREEGMGHYTKSKTLAEKAAWDFQASLPEGERFELATICPGFIMGPSLRKEDFASGGYCKRILTGEMNPISSDSIGTVDVRDCALMHKKAIEVTAAAGRRFISVASSPKHHDIARPIVEKYGALGWPVSTNYAPDDPSNYVSLFDVTPSTEILGVQYTELSSTMVEMADSLVQKGMITKPE